MLYLMLIFFSSLFILLENERFVIPEKSRPKFISLLQEFSIMIAESKQVS